MRLYKIEYRFNDEIEYKNPEWEQYHNALVVVYNKDDTDLIKALDDVAEGNPTGELDFILLDKFGLSDNNISWYQEGYILDEKALEEDAGITIRNSWDKTDTHKKHSKHD